MKTHRYPFSYAVPIQRRRALTRPSVLAAVGTFCFALVMLAAPNVPAQAQPQEPAEAMAAETKLPEPPLPTPAQMAQAQDIMRKTYAAYRDLTSYQGNARTKQQTLMGNTPFPSGNGTADISWVKPNLLHIAGKDTTGNPFTIISNGQTSWWKWPLSNKGQWKESKDLFEGISAMTGVAQLAPTTIPTLLQNPESKMAFRYAERAAVQADETIDDHPCFKLLAQGAEETRTWWIDKESFLLRRLVSSFSQEQSDKMLADVQKSMRKYAGEFNEPRLNGQMPVMRFVSRTQEFEIKAINQPIAPELFAAPTDD